MGQYLDSYGALPLSCPGLGDGNLGAEESEMKVAGSGLRRMVINKNLLL